MNTFVKSAINDTTTTRTENGDVTYSTSLNACVDLFFGSGAMRTADEKRITALFSTAYAENPEIATRIALRARDVREGAGERRFFRIVLQYLEKYDIDRLLRVLHLVPVLGRWDDLFSVMNTEKSARAVLELYSSALQAGDGLAAKWAPREKSDKLVAARLRGYMGLTRPQYRRLVSELSTTVEQLMCAGKFDQINYSHVPSVASARYTKAFRKHDNDRYTAYLDAVRSNKADPATGKVAKINTKAVYPYDVIKASVDDVTADTMWNNLPDYVPEGASFMPIVDVSGSMCAPVSGTTVTALAVSISLGVYLAERNKSAFKDLWLTFSSQPKFQRIVGNDIRSKFFNMDRTGWEMNTDLDAAMNLILSTAIKHGVSQSDMPSTLIVLSDMEFDGGYYSSYNTSVTDRTKAQFKAAGYEMPNIVWWNIISRHGNVPVRVNDKGMALVSGFSPTIMTSLLGGELTPENIMLKAIAKDRYNH